MSILIILQMSGTFTDRSTLDHLLFEHACWRSTCPGNYLDNQLFRPSRSRSAEFYSSPLIWCLRKVSGMTILFVSGIFFLYFSFASLKVAVDGYVPSADINSVKIIELKTGLGPLDVGSTHLQLHTECDSSLLTNISVHPVSILGFTIMFNWNGSCPHEAIFFELRESADASRSLSDIGATTVRWTAFGPRFLNNGVSGCAGPVSVSYLPPWPWQLTDQACLHSLLLGVAFLATLLCSAARRPRAAKTVLVTAFLISGLLSCAAALGFVSLGLYRCAFSPAVSGPLLVLFAVALSRHERCLAAAFLVCGGLLLVARAVDDCILFNDCAFLARQPPAAPAAAASLGLILLLLHRANMAILRAAIMRDLARYDAAWDAATCSMADRAALDAVDAELKCPDLAAAAMAERPQQSSRHFPSFDGRGLKPPDSAAGSAGHEAGFAERRRASLYSSDSQVYMPFTTCLGLNADTEAAAVPVVGLDQLYSQASGPQGVDWVGDRRALKGLAPLGCVLALLMRS